MKSNVLNYPELVSNLKTKKNNIREIFNKFPYFHHYYADFLYIHLLIPQL